MTRGFGCWCFCSVLVQNEVDTGKICDIFERTRAPLRWQPTRPPRARCQPPSSDPRAPAMAVKDAAAARSNVNQVARAHISPQAADVAKPVPRRVADSHPRPPAILRFIDRIGTVAIGAPECIHKRLVLHSALSERHV